MELWIGPAQRLIKRRNDNMFQSEAPLRLFCSDYCLNKKTSQTRRERNSGSLVMQKKWILVSQKHWEQRIYRMFITVRVSIHLLIQSSAKHGTPKKESTEWSVGADNQQQVLLCTVSLKASFHEGFLIFQPLQLSGVSPSVKIQTKKNIELSGSQYI